MATNFFNTKWSNRTPLEKYIILGGTGGILIFVALNRKKWIAAIKARRDRAIYEDDLGILTGGGDKATYLDSQYIIFANYDAKILKSIGTDKTYQVDESIFNSTTTKIQVVNA